LRSHRIIAVALACAALAYGQNSHQPALTAEQKRLNIESFEFIWSTIRDQYWDPALGGVNWVGVHDELRPQIERAVTMSQAREIMGRMMDRLGKSHSTSCQRMFTAIWTRTPAKPRVAQPPDWRRV
jgi:hypothetical protein